MSSEQPAHDDPVLRDALRTVIDPELGDNIVDLGMVRSVTKDAGGEVLVSIALTVAGCPLRSQIERDAAARLSSIAGVSGVKIEIAAMDGEERAAVMKRARLKARERAPETAVPHDARVIAIASGKGGVGKSSVAVNLSVALARRGLRVGLLDADVWGFSVPRLIGIEGTIEAEGGKMLPIELTVGQGSVRVLSMGFLSGEEEAIMWRGLLLNRAVQQFLQDANWGDIEYLLVDLPPGTGDVQMGLARILPRSEMILVTTPPVAAQKVAARAADMARRGYLRVTGVVENMSEFTCDHGETYALFGSGGGERLALDLGVPFLGKIPLNPAVAAGGDRGEPVAMGSGPLAEVFAQLAEKIADEISPIVETTTCSARLIEQVEKAVLAGADTASAPI
ncbi:MAG: Mrp/NBP35 family ATP-binding protein [Acidimicrobiales bacterium]